MAMTAPLVKAIAFYLPQFHEVKENSEWWGPGFTEWTNVARGRPNFKDHYQPHIPRDLGFYDLSNVEVMRRQAELARSYGLYGFCFYNYWFNGRRVLERPVNQYLASNIDFPFCFCWANENWTRRWDGGDQQILLKQDHNPEDDRKFLESLLPAFRDSRYIKVDGKPLLVVYRIDLFPDIQKTAELWRTIAREQGFPGLYLCRVQFHQHLDDPRLSGFDAAIEFPPHNFIGGENQPAPDDMPELTNPKFSGGMVDYQRVVAQGVLREPPGYPLHRGLFPSWDNTARRQDSAFMVINSNPVRYQFWLQYLVDYTRRNLPPSQQIVFINAWNEWAEGAHLEPDIRNQRQYLEGTAKALFGKALGLQGLIANKEILRIVAANTSEAEANYLERALEMCQFLPERQRPRRRLSERLKRWTHRKFPTAYERARALYRRFV